MKRKLEETGKKCSFKNYDIFQAKVCFSFLNFNVLFLINQFMHMNVHYGCPTGQARYHIHHGLTMVFTVLVAYDQKRTLAVLIHM